MARRRAPLLRPDRRPMLDEGRPQDQQPLDEVVLLRVPPSIAFVELKEPLERIEDSAADIALLFWILALAFFGLGDTISSFLVFSIGGAELNPIMRWSTTLPGGLLGFVLVKTVAISLLYALAYLWEGVHQWVIPVVMTIAGVYLTTSNLMVYMSSR